MNTPSVDAGRLERRVRRVRRVGRETMPDIHGFCPFFHSAQYAAMPLLRLTALRWLNDRSGHFVKPYIATVIGLKSIIIRP